ncbi:MAG TPA: 16S rRNA (adenine(1518)-N(6)/adenine(1519)-N(6))-dimethyltransferase RsmA, partial [Nitrospinota bacterium]|nr:16S rRNA (adenine(1518)-N(6)/adenine(1519)-N(6))-dimethyltransferase RsmA [Nitrospinota bacterium]
MTNYKKSSDLLSMTKTLIKKYRLRCKKSYGQNFLVDDFIQQKIIDCASLNKDDIVLEIGAGLGALTLPLAKRVKEVIAIESDKRLFDVLSVILKGNKNVELICQDALNFDYTSLKKPYKVVSNLPYSISTQIMIKLLGYNGKITEMILMFQKEIAERINASHGTRNYGFLSIIAQYHTDIDICFSVKKDSFFPMPKVDSSVIKLSFLKRPKVLVRDEKLFFNLVKASLSYKRKTLRNNLKRARHILDTNQLDMILKRAGIDPN